MQTRPVLALLLLAASACAATQAAPPPGPVPANPPPPTRAADGPGAPHWTVMGDGVNAPPDRNGDFKDSKLYPGIARDGTGSVDPATPGSGPDAAAPARPPITGLSHIAIYASQPAKSEHFYVHDLGAVKGVDVEHADGARYYFAPTQFVEVLPLPPHWTSFSRLDHVAFDTTDAAALRRYLRFKGVAVPARLRHGGDGSAWFDVKDPEGNDIQFVQPPAHPPAIAVNPLSRHMIHAGFIIHDRALEDTFYRGILGFRPYWYGGMTDTKPAWISEQVPDGTDWLEYMLAGTPRGRGIPPDMKKSDVGVLDHFSLGVRNIEVAYTLLWNGGRLEGQDNLPKIGRDAKWQLNLFDPDGTRAEIMELHAVGKPCCSPFTASDPTY